MEQIDGYVEHEKDIFEGFYKFIQEDNRILYPFVKVRNGGTDDFPQYYYRIYKSDQLVDK